MSRTNVNTLSTVVFLLFLIPSVLILYKVMGLGYSYQNILPITGYQVTVNMELSGYGEESTASTWLPLTNDRQFIWNEQQEFGAFRTESMSSAQGRNVSWFAPESNGKQHIKYTFEVRAEGVEYAIDSGMLVPGAYPPGIQKYLRPTVGIQSAHPQIIDQAKGITGERDRILEILNSIHGYISAFPNKEFKGYTDALTTLRLEEASCNGKSRLFAALCRAKGIPARLAGGLILDQGVKKTSHQWVEVYVNGFWIPFDTVNDHFAFIPANFLELYKEDEALFNHSANTSLNYLFNIEKRMVSNPQLDEELSGSALNSYKMWSAFERAGIPLGLIKIILLLPLGAMVVAICRNVIGFKTFGVFLPALIAVSIGYTGLVWGLFAFVLVIILVSIMHFPLERASLLYTPKLVIMLVSVVITFIALSIIGIYLDYTQLAYITLFPVVVITITAERFARTIMEEGYPKALNITVQTIIVVLAAYFAMNSRTMEAVFLAFPELFLIVIALMLVLGRWIGLRVAEYHRFKSIIG